MTAVQFGGLFWKFNLNKFSNCRDETCRQSDGLYLPFVHSLHKLRAKNKPVRVLSVALRKDDPHVSAKAFLNRLLPF